MNSTNQSSAPFPQLSGCPFCGAEARIDHSRNDRDVDTYCVNCSKCCCSLGEDDRLGAGDWADSHDFKSEMEAIIAWNTRAPDAQITGLRELAKEKHK